MLSVTVCVGFMLGVGVALTISRVTIGGVVDALRGCVSGGRL